MRTWPRGIGASATLGGNFPPSVGVGTGSTKASVGAVASGALRACAAKQRREYRIDTRALFAEARDAGLRIRHALKTAHTKEN
jgi:outer membrane lipoprotein SlyB